jgi:hypothetical protein
MSELESPMDHPKLSELIAAGVLPPDFALLSIEEAMLWLDTSMEDLDAKMARDQATIRAIEDEMTRRKLKPRGKR